MSNSVEVIKTKVEFEDILPHHNYEIIAKRSTLELKVYVKEVVDDVVYCSVEENGDKYLTHYDKKYLKKFNIYSIKEIEIKEFTTCSNPKCGKHIEDGKMYWHNGKLLCRECMSEILISDALKNKLIFDNWATNF